MNPIQIKVQPNFDQINIQESDNNEGEAEDLEPQHPVKAYVKTIDTNH